MRSDVKSVATLILGVSLFGVSTYFLYLLFKKDTDDEYNDAIPLITKQTKLEMKIPKEFVRTVIGRNGSHIKEIERKSATKINFKDQKSDEEFRICVIRGANKSCALAESLIHEFLAYQPVIETKDLWVPKVAIGRIIGRCGERIHYVSQLSGAKIHVGEPDSLDSAERRITFKGTSEQIAMAHSYVNDIVREDSEIRKKMETKLALREPRGKPRNENRTKATDVMKQSSEKLANNIRGGDGHMDVYVSAVIDPSQFWLQIVGPNASELDHLVEEMTEYYNKQENQELHVITELSVGDVVAAVFTYDNSWYRAEVVELKEENERQVAELYFLDYGDTDTVPVAEIFELRTDFLTLRYQAIECFLARVKPKDEEWTDEAIDKFEEWTEAARWKKLRARVHGYKDRDPKKHTSRAKREGSPIPGVDLYDVSKEEDLDIANKLVSHGYAVFENTVTGTGSGNGSGDGKRINSLSSSSKSSSEEQDTKKSITPPSVIQSPDFEEKTSEKTDQLTDEKTYDSLSNSFDSECEDRQESKREGLDQKSDSIDSSTDQNSKIFDDQISESSKSSGDLQDEKYQSSHSMKYSKSSSDEDQKFGNAAGLSSPSKSCSDEDKKFGKAAGLSSPSKSWSGEDKKIGNSVGLNSRNAQSKSSSDEDKKFGNAAGLSPRSEQLKSDEDKKFGNAAILRRRVTNGSLDNVNFAQIESKNHSDMN